LAAFIGYLVAGIAIGDWIVGRLSPAVSRERPYLAAVVGLVVLELVGILPLVSAIATLFGYGAVLLLAWRTLRADSTGSAIALPFPASAASAG
jgi:sorbitol-specific phosphotransferase system component IIBC